MSKKRHSNINDNEKQIGHLRGPNGFRLCRFCKQEVHPPRKTFCSDNCVHEWKLRSSTKYLREHIYKRDLGVCNACKSDTRLQKIKLENILKECGNNEKHPKYQGVLAMLKLTIKEARSSLWHGDHIVPIESGGGECGLENYQTLCIACHKSKNAGQASYRIKSIKPPKIRPMGMLKLGTFKSRMKF